MTACSVSPCGRPATWEVRWPISGDWPFCDYHARPHVQYAVPLLREKAIAR